LSYISGTNNYYLNHLAKLAKKAKITAL